MLNKALLLNSSQGSGTIFVSSHSDGSDGEITFESNIGETITLKLGNYKVGEQKAEIKGSWLKRISVYVAEKSDCSVYFNSYNPPPESFIDGSWTWINEDRIGSVEGSKTIYLNYGPDTLDASGKPITPNGSYKFRWML